jgi:HK97 family phage prohead protease
MSKEARKLPEKLEVEFIVCDNTLNRKGWRLLVEGVDMEGFKKNPVCIVQHDTWTIPVGKWKNLRVEGEQLLGTVEFDRNDDEAVRLYWKYSDGYMNAVSIHIIPIEESELQEHLVSGQRYATITKSELLEISLVTIPGQKNAIKLSTPEGEDYKLNIINSKKEKEMEGKENQEEINELKKQLEEQKKLNAKNLVSMHKERGVIEDGETEHFEKLALSDYETVEKILTARSPKKEKEEKSDEESKKLSEQVRKFAQQEDSKKGEREQWTYLDWYRKDMQGLFAMQKNEPEKYKKLEESFAAEAEEKQLKIENQ